MDELGPDRVWPLVLRPARRPSPVHASRERSCQRSSPPTPMLVPPPANPILSPRLRRSPAGARAGVAKSGNLRAVPHGFHKSLNLKDLRSSGRPATNHKCFAHNGLRFGASPTLGGGRRLPLSRGGLITLMGQSLSRRTGNGGRRALCLARGFIDCWRYPGKGGGAPPEGPQDGRQPGRAGAWRLGALGQVGPLKRMASVVEAPLIIEQVARSRTTRPGPSSE